MTRVVQRLFGRDADLFPIREGGGCYFVPERHAPFVDRVGRFLGALGGSLRHFPVPAGTVRGDRSVRDAVAAGLAAVVHQQTSEALAKPHQEIHQAVKDAKAKYTDETGWKLRGQRYWL